MVGAGRFELPTSSPLRRELLFFLSLPVPFRCFPSLDLRGSGQDPGEAWPFPGCNFGCKFPQSCRFPRPLAVGELDASLLYFLFAARVSQPKRFAKAYAKRRPAGC